MKTKLKLKYCLRAMYHCIKILLI